jgi:hypothetical protein
VGFVVDKVALGQVFSEYFGFLCQFSFHRLLHIHHHLPSGATTINQLVAEEPSGLSLTPQKSFDEEVGNTEMQKMTCVYVNYADKVIKNIKRMHFLI